MDGFSFGTLLNYTIDRAELPTLPQMVILQREAQCKRTGRSNQTSRSSTGFAAAPNIQTYELQQYSTCTESTWLPLGPRHYQEAPVVRDSREPRDSALRSLLELTPLLDLSHHCVVPPLEG